MNDVDSFILSSQIIVLTEIIKMINNILVINKKPNL